MQRAHFEAPGGEPKMCEKNISPKKQLLFLYVLNTLRWSIVLKGKLKCKKETLNKLAPIKSDELENTPPKIHFSKDVSIL